MLNVNLYLSLRHLGMSSVNDMPMSRGFDHFFGTLNGALGYFSKRIGNSCNYNNPSIQDMFPILWGSNCYAIFGFDVNDDGRPALEEIGSGEHYTSLLGRKAVERISLHNSSDKPLFMYLAPTAPHSPLEVTGRAADKCRHVTTWPPSDTINLRSMVCQLMAGVDEMIGDVISALDAKGMLQNTVFVYMSDNGGIKIFGSKNADLKGQKGSFFEGGVRIPGFISGFNIPATEYDGLTFVTDIFATIATLAGIFIPFSFAFFWITF